MTFPRILEIGPTKIGAFREPSWGCKRQLERRCDLAKLGVWSPDFLIWGSGRWAGGHRLKRLLNIIWNGGWIGVNHINLGWCCRGNNYAGNLGRNFKGDAVMPKIRWGGVHFEEQISFDTATWICVLVHLHHMFADLARRLWMSWSRTWRCLIHLPPLHPGVSRNFATSKPQTINFPVKKWSILMILGIPQFSETTRYLGRFFMNHDMETLGIAQHLEQNRADDGCFAVQVARTTNLVKHGVLQIICQRYPANIHSFIISHPPFYG